MHIYQWDVFRGYFSLPETTIVFFIPKVSYRRQRHSDVNAITTNKTTAEFTLSANDDYLIQVKALSEGGEGVGSEPIHIQKLSKCTPPPPPCSPSVLLL